MAEIFVIKAAELKDGDRRIVKTPRGEIGVFAHEGTYYAYANTCSHTDGPVCEGLLIPKVLEVLNEDKTYVGHTFSDQMNIVCPWHGWEYDLKTGACIGAKQHKLKKFETVIRSGDLYVVA
jgi:nitrite reductase/ring-hydroxylating ferredoxin subunit